MNQGELFTAFLVDLQRIFRTEVVPKNLSYSQVLAIIIIPDDGIEMSELARTLGLENSTVTRLIARLERNNYVTRKKSEADKRSINVFLDQKGVMLQTDIEKKIDKIGNQIFLKNNQVEKELFLENLSLFQWSLKKTFLKK
jgi:DNA-binding MarR family transcriptional regulator